MTNKSFSLHDVQDCVIQALARQAGCEALAIGPQHSLKHLGLSSIEAIAFVGHIEESLDLMLDLTILYEHATVDSLARYLFDRMAARTVAVTAPACLD